MQVGPMLFSFKSKAKTLLLFLGGYKGRHFLFDWTGLHYESTFCTSASQGLSTGLSIAQSYTSGGCCHARRCQPHWEQFRVRCLVQGHHDMWAVRAKIWTAAGPLNYWRTQPPNWAKVWVRTVLVGFGGFLALRLARASLDAWGRSLFLGKIFNC